MADGNREFQRPTRSQFVRPPLRQSGLRLPASACSVSHPLRITSQIPRSPGCRAGRISKIRGRRNSSAGIRSTCSGGCDPNFPGYYRHLEGFGANTKKDQALLPFSHWIIDPGSFAAQSHQLRRHRSGGAKICSVFPQLRFHFQWGENELMMWEHSKQMMADLFKAAGGRDVGCRRTQPRRHQPP